MAVIVSCDKATRETRKIIILAHKLQEEMPLMSLERNEILNLILLAKNVNPCYNAIGFFKINRTTLFALLRVTTTYFIIIVQFNLQPL